MKKNIFTVILGSALVLFAGSASKADAGLSLKHTDMITKISSPHVAAPLEGRWSGYYNNGNDIGPTYFFALNFKPDGSLSAEANNTYAYGTYTVMGDHINATYTFPGKGGTYSLEGMISGNVIYGTIGYGSQTSGAFVFSVTQE